ncbi:hypothetical protein A4D02_34815 [Niastella koreensis]|uniref:HlyD family secretion protein n=2 Tax=Niastella koreensis TaxID=354356 RepID=G8TKI7_NIAKG|nr:hypothetical protein [Niastella koreensis]AEV98661.1 hypothetical protein Niako_2317 [Niastella koreensis GR20-10]OQP44399.1 hypothetical protein A4D02_34815 [Niastella koreensis]
MPTNYKTRDIKSNYKGTPLRTPGYIDLNTQTGVVPSKPGGIYRWIFPHFAGVLFLGLAVLWFIPHPEIIKTTGTVTGIDAQEKMLYINIAAPEDSMQTIRSGQLIQIRVKEQPGAQFDVVTGRLLQVSAGRLEHDLMAKVLLSEFKTAQYNRPGNKSLKVNLVIVVKDLRLLQCIFKNPLKQMGK